METEKMTNKVALENLKAFSQLAENEKLLVVGKNVQLDQRYCQWFRRWLSGDNRKKTIDVMNDTIDHLRQAVSDGTLKKAPELKIYLTLAFSGLLKLEKTYPNETMQNEVKTHAKTTRFAPK